MIYFQPWMEVLVLGIWYQPYCTASMHGMTYQFCCACINMLTVSNSQCGTVLCQYGYFKPWFLYVIFFLNIKHVLVYFLFEINQRQSLLYILKIEVRCCLLLSLLFLFKKESCSLKFVAFLQWQHGRVMTYLNRYCWSYIYIYTYIHIGMYVCMFVYEQRQGMKMGCLRLNIVQTLLRQQSGYQADDLVGP